MQEKDTINQAINADLSDLPGTGRILAIDPGTKRLGLAVSDATQTVTRPLQYIKRTSWKRILERVKDLLSEYDAKALVIGLPLESDGRESEMSAVARDMARKFSLSLGIPVFLQDERLTSYEAKGHLWQQAVEPETVKQLVDSEAAVIILTDFLDRTQV